MILYILALGLCGLLALGALGTSIFALLKKRKKLAVMSLSALCVLSITGIALSYIYVRKSIDYVASDEFQKDTRKKAAGLGKTWGSTVSGVSEGLSSTLDDEAIAKLANKTAVITSKIIKATSAGLDTTVSKVSVVTDKSVADAGLLVGRAEESVGSGGSMGLFIEFGRAFKGFLKLTAYDAQGSTISVAEEACNEGAKTAKMVVFGNSNLSPGISGYCILKAIPAQ